MKAQCNFTPSYTQDFSTYTPACWTETSGRLGTSSTFTSTSSDWTGDGFLNNGTSGAAGINIFGTTRDEWLVSPIIDLGTGAYQVEFDVGLTDYYGSGNDLMGADDTLAVVISLDAGVTWSTSNILKLYVAGNQPSNLGESVLIDLSAYSGSVKIGFYAASTISNTDYNVYIDNFVVNPLASCLYPTGLIASAVTGTGASLSWTENGSATSWQVEYGLSGYAIGSGTKSIEPATPATLNSLMGNTDYDVYVRAICAPGDTSAWSNSTSFTTLCTTYSAPYNQDFATFVPDCWDEAGSGTPVTGPSGLGSGDWESADFLNSSINGDGASINLYDNDDEEWIISPVFDLTTGSPLELVISAGVTNYSSTTTDNMGSDDEVLVLISEDNMVTWDTLYTWNAANQPPNTGADYNISLAGYNTNNNIIAIYATDGTIDDNEDYDFHIGNFQIRTEPSCLVPNALSSSAVNSTSATIVWTENNSATDWQVSYGVSGFTAGSGMEVVTTTNPYSISSLTENTDYDVYVRSICASGDTSTWSLVSSFSTPCALFLAPFTEDFDGLALTSPYTDLPNCWEPQTLSDLWGVTNDITNTGHEYLPNIGDHTTGTGNYMWIDASTDIIANEMVTPFIDMSALTTPYIGFWFASNNVNNSINHSISLDAWDGSAWVNIRTVSGNFPSWYEVAGVLPSGVPTTTKFRIQAIAATGTTSSNYFQNDLGVDDFFVVEAPSCLATNNETALNITSNSADLSWTHPTATSFEVVWGPPGFSPSTSVNSVITATNSSTLSTLTSITDYEWYVRAICSVGDNSAWSTAQSFTTICSSYTAPYYNGFENDAVDIAPACWDSYSTISNGFVEVEDFTGTAAPFTGSQALYIYSGSGFTVGSDTLLAVSPNFSDLPAGDKRIRFMANSDNVTTRLIVGTVASPVPTATFNPIETVTFLADDTYQQVIINLDAANGYNGTDEYIVFVHELDGGTFKYVRIDDFNYELIPSCVEPSNLSANTIGATSVDLSWTENGTGTSWQVEYGITGYPAGTGTRSVESGMNASLTGLTDNTTYDAYVRAICAVGDTSAWSLVSSFTTDFISCNPTTPVVLPFLEDWESTNGTVSGPSNIVCAPDYTWFVLSSDPSGRARYGTDAQSASSGLGAISLDRTPSGNVIVNHLILTLDMSSYTTDTGLELSFDYAHHGEESHANDSLWIRGDNSSAWVGIYDLFANKAAIGVYKTVGPIDIDAALAAASQTVSTSFQVRFGQEDDYPAPSDGFTFDNISIISNPPCLDPSALNVSNFTGISADLDWTENGTATAWNIEYGPAGFTPGSGTIIPVTSNPHTLSGLNPCSDYDYYVQSDCGAGNLSAQVGPFAFSTLSVPLTDTDVQSECDSYTWIDGNTYTASNNTATFTIAGAGAFGCDSLLTLDLTINNSVTGVDSQNACNSYTWIDGNVYTSNNNTATFTIVGGAANGCDSIVTLDLMLDIVDVTTTQTDGVYLSANATGAMYQWIDCDNGNAPIVGENNKDFTVLVNGNYAVIVMENGCLDTSACILVDNVGLKENGQISGVSLYPNPTNGIVTVQFDNMDVNQYTLEVVDATGRKLSTQTITENSTIVDLSTYEKGVYIIRVSNGNSESIHRVIRR